jgi:sulfate adenylyltransferase
MTTKILDERELCDLECLSSGTFAPLTSYMTKRQYESCLDTLKISENDVFPIPIVCTLSAPVEPGTLVTMKTVTGTSVATLQVSECWEPDMTREWLAVFGSDDPNHPYIQYMKSKGPCHYVSGTLIVYPSYQWHSSFMKERRTPAELKALGPWIGFQTRNPLHRSHIELIQRSAAGVGAKVLLHPVEGVTQECDIPFPVRMKCYRQVLSKLPTEATLSILPLSMRMAGPREAVWHAVIRRNYGCSHFIVGRDHAGPSYKKQDGSSFYGPLDAQRLAKSLEDDIGIKIVTSEEVVYCEDTSSYMTTTEAQGHDVKQISGTQFRTMLENGTPVPSWYSWPAVTEPLQKFYQKPHGVCVYFVGLSGSGKTTLAQALKARLQDEWPHKEVTVLDADEIRTHLSKGLGFSKEDRSMNVRRIGYVASEIVRHGGIVLVANIAPYEEDRAANRSMISQHGSYLEVFVDTSLDTCESRDVKGLYKAARAGTIKQFTGISDPFEVPTKAHVIREQNIDAANQEVWDLVAKKVRG